jgi:phenylpyruvate tautomerase PptA (4-oxalocrotonate tautomerase family)
LSLPNGTNDREQEAVFVREVNRQLERILRHPGYVHVNEISDESWGFAGEVQTKRSVSTHRGSIAACAS